MNKQSEQTPAAMTSDKIASKSVQSEAATEMAKDAVKDQIAMDTGTTPSDEDNEKADRRNRFLGSDETQPYAYLLDGGLAGLEKVTDKKDGLAENILAGLLILERNGQNRTEYVRLLTKRLGIKDIKKELPQAGGPDYTNDTTNLRDL